MGGEAWRRILGKERTLVSRDGDKEADLDPTLRSLAARFAEAIVCTHAYRGDATAETAPDRIVEVCRFLRDEPELSFDFLMDLTVVDWLGHRGLRFEVVYHFYSLRHGRRVRLKVRLPEENPQIDSISPIFPAANWHEREAYDMYGVVFHGHPDLRRILLYPEFQGHPLRKDYPKEKVQPLVGIADLEEDTGRGRRRA